MSIVSTRFGKMRIIDKDEVVSRALSLYGEWAMDEVSLLAKLIRPGMCVLDVGAFIGTHTLAFSKFVGPTGKVYSFEPRKEIYEILTENVSINDCENVSALNVGLAEKEQILTLPLVDINQVLNFGGLSLETDNALPSSGTCQVHISTIDGLDFEKIDLIKLDVEGMERKVLDGAVKTILRDRPMIFCECNSLSGGARVFELSQSMRYDTYGFLSAAYNPKNYNGVSDNIFGAAKELALILIPQEQAEGELEKISNASLVPIGCFDDLVLPLLHKPQYVYEVLAHTAPSSILGVNFSSAVAVEGDWKIASVSLVADQLKAMQALNSRIDVTDKALSEAQKLASDRLGELHTLTNRLDVTDKALGEAQHLASERLGELQALNSRIDVTDKALGEAQHLASERLGELQALHAQLDVTDIALGEAQHLADERQRDILALNDELAQLRQIIFSIEQTGIWRLLRKVRLIKVASPNAKK